MNRLWNSAARPLLLSTLAVLLALAAQRQLGIPAARLDTAVPYAFVVALILFIAAFPGTTGSAGGDREITWRHGILATVGVLLAMLAFHDFTEDGPFLRAVGSSLSSVALLGWAFASERAEIRPRDGVLASLRASDPKGRAQGREIPSADDAPHRAFWESPWPGVLFLAIVLAVAAMVLWWREQHTNLALAVNVISLVLFFAVIRSLDRESGMDETALKGGASSPDAAQFPIGLRSLLQRGVVLLSFPRWVEVLVLGLIAAAAMGLRLYRLNDVPYGVWYDAAEAGLEAIEIIQGRPFSPIGRFTSNNPTLFHYLVGLSFRVLGANLFALRLTTALVGTATIIGFYALVRASFGRRTAIVAATLLAASNWHVNFSRIGMGYHALALFFEAFALSFLVRGLRDQHMLSFGLAGMMTGLGLYTFAGFRLFPLVVAIYLLYELVMNQHAIRRKLLGVAVFTTIALVTFVPLGIYAARHPQDFARRLSQTSLFVGKETTQEKITALESNVRKHALMFNLRGDGNGRHGIPDAPALDAVSAAMFVLGFGYCLYRWRSPAYFLAMVWFLVTLQAGILSLDWEAPQAARSIVALPAVCVIAALPLGMAWHAWWEAGRWSRTASILLAAVIMIIVLRINADRYFRQQMGRSDVFNAFSTGDTAVARTILDLGKERYRFYLQNQGTPTFRFLVEGLDRGQGLDQHFFWPIDHLPLREHVEKDVAYVMEPWRVSLLPDSFRHYYPGGTYHEVKNPFGNTMVSYFTVTSEDISAAMGLTGRYYSGSDVAGEPQLTRRDPRIAFDWRWDSPFGEGTLNVEWDGTLFIPRVGSYVFGTRSVGASEVYVDGQMVVDNPRQSDGEAHSVGASEMLVKGWHSLRVRCQDCGAGVMELYWTPPGQQMQIVPQEALNAMPLPSHGLLGSYYRGSDWGEPAAYRQIDPLISFRWQDHQLRLPWSATWQGYLQINVSGVYQFELVSNDYAILQIDGQNVAEGISHALGSVHLEPGLHEILLRYRATKGYEEMRLFWTPPGGNRDVIPLDRLIPAPVGTGTPVVEVRREPAVQLVPPAAVVPAEVQVVEPRPLATWGGYGTGQEQFNSPQDVAVDGSGNVYIVDTGNRRVQKFDRTGRFVVQWGDGDGLVEPFGIAVDDDQHVFVLDTGTSTVYKYDSEGHLLATLGRDLGLYSPRGIAIGLGGDVYIADTGGNRVVRVSQDTGVVSHFGDQGDSPGQFVQPADLTVDSRGLVFVVDTGNYRVQVFDSAGIYLYQWSLPVPGYSIVSGPRIALGPQGTVLLTDQERGQLFYYDPQGQLLAMWSEIEGLIRPAGIAVDGEGNLYITDVGAHRVHKLRLQ